jgi:hypothetical protein
MLFILLLIPKILWGQKLVVCYLDTLWKEKFKIKNKKFYYIHISQPFLATPSISNCNSICVYCGILFKRSWKFNFLIFFEEPLHVAMWSNMPFLGLKVGCQKKINFVYRILGFHFFQFLFFVHGSTWCWLQCSHYNLNLKSLGFSRNFISSIVLEFEIRPH